MGGEAFCREGGQTGVRGKKVILYPPYLRTTTTEGGGGEGGGRIRGESGRVAGKGRQREKKTGKRIGRGGSPGSQFQLPANKKKRNTQKAITYRNLRTISGKVKREGRETKNWVSV